MSLKLLAREGKRKIKKKKRRNHKSQEIHLFQMISPLFLLIICFICTQGEMVAYDCAAQSANITTISLLNIKPCNIENRKPIITDTNIRLLQLSRFSKIHVKFCQVKLERTIKYCGRWSYNYLVHNGIAQYLVDMTPELCHEMHTYKTFRHRQSMSTGLRMNGTSFATHTLAGTVSSDGYCTGASFSDIYGSWDNVLVIGNFEITLHDYDAPVNLEEDKVYMRHGRHCKLSNNMCMDNDGSTGFWISVPHDKCSFSEYDVLYEGPAKRIYDNTTTTEGIEEVYSVQNGEVTFGLARKGVEYVCDRQLVRTEHPKLFILEIEKNNKRQVEKSIPVENLDLMAYVNSKFVHVEKHFGKQLKDLYIDVLTQKCELERRVLENSLLIAHSRPAEFALRVMKGPGYMAHIAGEVVHVIKCIPVPVTLARLETCYSHLPVIVHNETMFMTPHTHILLRRSPKVDCNGYISPMYKINDKWIRLNPTPDKAVSPEELEPLTKPTWKYESLSDLATSGIYSDKDLIKLQDHLMFSEEQTAILDTIARGSIGETINTDGISFAQLIDDSSIEKIAQRATTKLWSWFTGFGTVSAGMIGVFITMKAIKFTVDTLIHGYALHRAFGWGVWLLGAFWDSVSNFLLHFKPKKPETTEDKHPTKIENPKPVGSAPDDDFSQTGPQIYPDIRIAPLTTFHYPKNTYEH